MSAHDPFAALAGLPGVAAAVAEARAAVDQLLGHRVLRRRSAEVTAESSLRCARASAALAGAHFELERLRGLLMRGLVVDDPVVAGSVRVNAGLGGLREVWATAPRQALAQLHVLAASGLAEAEGLGRPALAEAGDGAAAARLDALCDALTAPTSAPAVVVAAVVHAELAVLAPFGSADGVVARAAEQLTLVARGLDPKAVSAPAVGHWELREAYPVALAAYADGDVAGWLVHCGRAVALGAREGLAVCEALLREVAQG